MAPARKAPASDGGNAPAAQTKIAEEYITVAERVQQFYADHPNGKLVVTDRELVTVGEYTSWVVEARAYPDYRIPEWYADGVAEERRPGLTAFTRNSELQNAETAAKGRAIQFLGYATHAGIATAEEIRARAAERELTDDGSPLEEQKQRLADLVAELDELQSRPWLDEVIVPWFETNTSTEFVEANRAQYRTIIAKVERMVEKLREELAAGTEEKAAKDKA